MLKTFKERNSCVREFWLTGRGGRTVIWLSAWWGASAILFRRGMERKSVPSGEATALFLCLALDPPEATQAALFKGPLEFFLPLHAIDCLLCWADVSNFDVISRVCFRFCRLCFWYRIQKVVSKANAEELRPLSFGTAMVSGLAVKSLTRVDVLFVCGVR